MDLRLTDVLACPRCGPGFGLVLLAHRVSAGRLVDGDLGCPNCRERYPVRDGFADLRPPPREPLPESPALEPGGGEEAFRLTALMGVAEGPGWILVAGEDARLAPGIAGIVNGIEVIAAHPGLRSWGEQAGVSRIAAAGRLPFHGRPLRAVALTGGADPALLPEAVRLLAPAARLVLDTGLPDGRAALEALDLDVLVDEAGVTVARVR